MSAWKVMVCHPPLALNGLHAKSTEMQRRSGYGQGDRTSRGPEPQPRPYRPRKYPIRCPPTCYPSLTSQHPRDRGRSPPKTPQSPPTSSLIHRKSHSRTTTHVIQIWTNSGTHLLNRAPTTWKRSATTTTTRHINNPKPRSTRTPATPYPTTEVQPETSRTNSTQPATILQEAETNHTFQHAYRTPPLLPAEMPPTRPIPKRPNHRPTRTTPSQNPNPRPPHRMALHPRKDKHRTHRSLNLTLRQNPRRHGRKHKTIKTHNPTPWHRTGHNSIHQHSPKNKFRRDLTQNFIHYDITIRCESFNSAVRLQNIFVNKQAPSRDIANQIAVVEHLHYICNGGIYNNNENLVIYMLTGRPVELQVDRLIRTLFSSG